MKVGWKTIMKQQKLVEKMTIEEKEINGLEKAVIL